jgi:hypothetical protein
MNPEHIPCVAIVVAVCAVVLCVALSLARKVNFGAGSSDSSGPTALARKSDRGDLPAPSFGAGGGDERRRTTRIPMPATRTHTGEKPALGLPGGWVSAGSPLHTRTIPNEQAKRRAMWAKIVRKM